MSGERENLYARTLNEQIDRAMHIERMFGEARTIVELTGEWPQGIGRCVDRGLEGLRRDLQALRDDYAEYPF